MQKTIAKHPPVNQALRTTKIISIIVRTIINIIKTILNIILTRIGMVGRLRGWEVFVSRKGAEARSFFCQQIKRMKQFFYLHVSRVSQGTSV